MKGQTHGGKGSAQRPTNTDKYDAGWEKIFGAKLRGLSGSHSNASLGEDPVSRMQPEASGIPEQTEKSGD